ncbi:ribonuclease R [Anaerosalibacter massiliensis]|uniref:Ribonuclease R n=2 Tax=Anaerosalibacter massiliensis TaxID=1347392 RepID=A0A9X2MHD6_9FIRM|nr:ribonuclease R [Anaerosalibacter massiliensis]MCR2043105.1 ribonuclease R [Anaerosalibacter massiliensis]
MSNRLKLIYTGKIFELDGKLISLMESENMNIKRNIVNFMDEKLYKPMTREELAKSFEIGKGEEKTFYNVLEDMEKEGTIIKTRNERYGLPEKMNLVVGKLEGNEKGYGFLVPEKKDREDIYISAENINGALHGDKVVVRVIKKGEEGRREEGEILRILDRANNTIVGTFESSKNFGFVLPDDNRISMDIFIPKAHMNNALPNQKVIVEITRWPEKRRNPEGKIIEVLGYIDEKGTDILSVIRQFNLSEEFPNKVINQVNSIEQSVSQEEIGRRVDLRDLNTFTIDGEDAKDFDDAVSIEKLENGNYKLGVHIADVSHYVKENSPLDKEALNRGNSIYLVDRVIPMLPKELSNGICSLNPKEPRLTLSVFMEIDKKGNVKEHKVIETVIESKERLIYDDVSDLLEKDDEELKDRYSHIYEDLVYMKELCHILNKKRQRRGSLDFDFPETEIILDNEGNPIDIRKEERRIANRMIEEFMLVCNETIAENMYWSQMPLIYRVHEDPDADEIEEFNKFIHNFGYNLKGTKEIHPKELKNLMVEVKGKKEEELLNKLLLRSLKKAKYSSEVGSHFGLAAKYYCHFTSPIRRYPDLEIHRIIKEYINGRLKPNKVENLESKLPQIAEQSSTMERIAEEAEREVEDLKKAQYMKERIGNEYKGIISSLTHFGIFVQLENTIEGLVHFSNMVDDYYYYDEEKYYIIGELTKKKFRIGDEVKIKVIGADVLRGNVDFMLVE